MYGNLVRVGGGGFGVVYRGVRKRDGREVAVKVEPGSKINLLEKEFQIL